MVITIILSLYILIHFDIIHSESAHSLHWGLRHSKLAGNILVIEGKQCCSPRDQPPHGRLCKALVLALYSETSPWPTIVEKNVVTLIALIVETVANIPPAL